MEQDAPTDNPYLNGPIRSALDLYRKAGVDAAYWIEWHFINGIIMSDNRVFVMGFACNNENPMVTLPLNDLNANCLHVTMLAGSMFYGLLPYADRFDYVCFRRDIKGDARFRTYEMSRMLSKL